MQTLIWNHSVGDAALELMKDQRWEVAIVTHSTLASFVRDEGQGQIRFYPLKGDPSAVLHSPEFIHEEYNGGTMDCVALFIAS